MYNAESEQFLCWKIGKWALSALQNKESEKSGQLQAVTFCISQHRKLAIFHVMKHGKLWLSMFQTPECAYFQYMESVYFLCLITGKLIWTAKSGEYFFTLIKPW